MFTAILIISILLYFEDSSNILNVSSKAFDLTDETATVELRTKLQIINANCKYPTLNFELSTF
jgi:hypothetical protein